jgi:hypothetical protein
MRKGQKSSKPHPNLVDVRGQKFGAWTVCMADPVRNENGQTAWLCRCDCGTERVVVSQPLRSGLTKSCGCLMGDFVSKSKTKHGHSANVTRRAPKAVSEQAAINKKLLKEEKRRSFEARTAYRQSATYKRWMSMRKRVRDKTPDVFKHYGAKGITVCERWNNFENFLADMGECPEGLTLDRIDPNKSYGPDNCRWATWSMQVRQRTMLEVCPNCRCLRQVIGSDRPGVPS